ncbi:MAG: hypothetical protein M3Q45_06220, partial [Chloroflexota bacterium]|nr:hypothetical protein [Chloroflexota bacterium]
MTRTTRPRIPSWAYWTIGAVTLLAIALLILAVVLGVRAGQQQIDIQRRQQVGIALQQAVDFRSEGNLEAALDAYRRVLILDPSNASAVEGIGTLLQQAATGEEPAMAAAPAVAMTNTTVGGSNAGNDPALAAPGFVALPTPATAADDNVNLDGLLRAAQSDFDAGRWQEAVNQLLSIRQIDATYTPEQIESLLFDAYVNLATERDNEDKLEEALAFYDQALALDPSNITIQGERNLIATYVDMLTNYGADWAQAVALLQTLYAEEPTYRDVSERLQTALVSYGDTLSEQTDLCGAAAQFNAALDLEISADLSAKRDEAQQLCNESDGVASSNGFTATINPTRSLVTAISTATVTTTTEATVETPTPTDEPIVSTGEGPSVGRILYSARDATSGRSRILIQPVAGGAPTVLQEDAIQPALSPNGQ